MQLKDKVVVVTGATGALGEAVIKAFLEAGASLVGTYREERQARQLEEAVSPPKGRLDLRQVDLTDANAVTRLFSDARDRFGRLDVLVNGAGASRGGKPVHESSPLELDLMLASNLKTAYLCSAAAIPLMLARGRGRIINVAARAGLAGEANLGAYGPAKAALINLTEVMAAETRATGITVNCVVPSVIDTAANRQALPAAQHELWPKTEDIAKVILFLACDDSAAVSGAVIPTFGRSV